MLNILQVVVAPLVIGIVTLSQVWLPLGRCCPSTAHCHRCLLCWRCCLFLVKPDTLADYGYAQVVKRGAELVRQPQLCPFLAQAWV